MAVDYEGQEQRAADAEAEASPASPQKSRPHFLGKPAKSRVPGQRGADPAYDASASGASASRASGTGSWTKRDDAHDVRTLNKRKLKDRYVKKNRKTKERTRKRAGAALDTLTPFLSHNVYFVTLRVKNTPDINEARRLLDRAVECLARREVLRGAHGAIFRHGGEGRVKPHVHLILGSVERLDLERLKTEAFELTGGKRTGGFAYARRVYTLDGYGNKRFWLRLDSEERRAAVGEAVAYALRGVLATYSRGGPWTRRFDRVQGLPATARA